MEAIEYLKLATDKTEAGDLIKENNLTEAVVRLMDNYAEFRVKNCSIPDVVGQSEQLPTDIEIEKSRIEGVLLGLKICKEMWAQGTISHEEIVENEIYYKEELLKAKS